MANRIIEMAKPVLTTVLSLLLLIQCGGGRQKLDAPNLGTTPSPLQSSRKDDCDFSKFAPMKAQASHGSSVISSPKPQYPDEAKERAVEGNVAVRLLVNVRTGLVEQACVIEGDEVFTSAAKEAGLRVKFSPYNEYIQKNFAYAEEIITYQFTKP